MKPGDLVRFESVGAGKFDNPPYSKDGKWRLGLLISYESWEKIGVIFYCGSLIRVRAENIQKAGKKDESR